MTYQNPLEVLEEGRYRELIQREPSTIYLQDGSELWWRAQDGELFFEFFHLAKSGSTRFVLEPEQVMEMVKDAIDTMPKPSNAMRSVRAWIREVLGVRA